MSRREEKLYKVVELAQAGRLDEAGRILDGLLAVTPDDPDANAMRGAVLMAMHRAREALPHFARAAQAKQSDPGFRYNFARALVACGQPEVAEPHARAALQPAPTDPDRAMLLATCLRAQGREREAEAVLRPAAEARPTPTLLNELGLCLSDQNRADEAEAVLRRTLDLAPNMAQAWHNLGNTFLDRHRASEAADAFRRSLELRPEHAESRVHLGQALLLQGIYQEGWQEYEARWSMPQRLSVREDLTTPLWDGAPLAGRRLLLYAEQGFGDTLQFARFVPMAAQRGGRIILDVPPALHRLLGGLPGAAQVSRQDAPAPDHDLRLPLMSLPRVLGITLETLPAAPYLSLPDPGPWAERLAHHSGRKVGLAWKALAEKRGSALRSVPLAALSPLFALPGISWISLQKDVPAEDRPLPPDVHDLSGHLGDFADTAALIAGLNLVVTVDTAVAHLAGAMGKPVWVMLPAGCDWRWLMAREDSPWYPTARLYRQPAPGDWQSVIAALARDLMATAP